MIRKCGGKFWEEALKLNDCCVIKYSTANGINNITVNLTYFFFLRFMNTLKKEGVRRL